MPMEQKQPATGDSLVVQWEQKSGEVRRPLDAEVISSVSNDDGWIAELDLKDRERAVPVRLRHINLLGALVEEQSDDEWEAVGHVMGLDRVDHIAKQESND